MKIASVLLVLSLSAYGQVIEKWYKFDKRFIEHHYSADGSAIGALEASAMHPAKNPHSVDCGGDDGELHIGVEESALGNSGVPISSLATQADSNFGIVAEPPNVTRSTQFFKAIEQADGSRATFFGYIRLWNEGHDEGPIFPSNPHHVLEVHPAWGIRADTFVYAPRPAVVFAMPKFSGYGASKFVPLLSSVPTWLRVAEDQRFVYVHLRKADNFYQMPVFVKRVGAIGNGKGVEALVDVFSDSAHQNLVYPNLTVITAANDPLSSRLQPNRPTFLLGFFSVNLKKAAGIASGHARTNAVQAPGALEFFAFGVPLQKAVSSSHPCVEEDD